MAAIRAGTGLRKVKESDKRDRSAAAVPGNSNESASAAPAGGAAGGGMMGALQEALNKRKQKVSGSGTHSILMIFPYKFRIG